MGRFDKDLADLLRAYEQIWQRARQRDKTSPSPFEAGQFFAYSKFFPLSLFEFMVALSPDLQRDYMQNPQPKEPRLLIERCEFLETTIFYCCRGLLESRWPSISFHSSPESYSATLKRFHETVTVDVFDIYVHHFLSKTIYGRSIMQKANITLAERRCNLNRAHIAVAIQFSSEVGAEFYATPIVQATNKNWTSRESYSHKTAGGSRARPVADTAPMEGIDAAPVSVSASYELAVAEFVADIMCQTLGVESFYEKMPKLSSMKLEDFEECCIQIMKDYLRNLKNFANGKVQQKLTQLLCSRQCCEMIIFMITSAFGRAKPYSAAIRSLLEDRRDDRRFLLERFIHESLLDPGMLFGNGTDYLDTEKGDYDSDYAQELGNSTPHDLTDSRKFGLKDFEFFLVRGKPAYWFRSNLSDLLSFPRSLEGAIDSTCVPILKLYISSNFPSVSTGDYEWLRELQEAGYSYQDMAELLVQGQRDTPWIYFTPRQYSVPNLDADFHLPRCCHRIQSLQNLNAETEIPQQDLWNPTQFCSIQRQIQELCGIGGVSPFKRSTQWLGGVFLEESTNVLGVTYGAKGNDPESLRGSSTWASTMEIISNLSQILKNFCKAAAILQSAQCCCNGFTVLMNKQSIGESVEGVENCLVLRKIDFKAPLELYAIIARAAEEFNIDQNVLDIITDLSIQILGEFWPNLASRTPLASFLGVPRASSFLWSLFSTASPLGHQIDTSLTITDSVLHICSLATQFLCMGLYSYVQAHIGPVNPFFLDKGQTEIDLRGSFNADSVRWSSVKMRMVELTCLSYMTHQPVLSFHLTAPSYYEGRTRYDVLATATNAIDTWGPGYVLCNANCLDKVHAIRIRDGWITSRDGRLAHWETGNLDADSNMVPFGVNDELLIGSGVTVNDNCILNETLCRNNSFHALEPLGPQPSTWRVTERQAGLQGGQYVFANFAQTWKMIPGMTLKEFQLQQDDRYLISFLDLTWGLQVSFCTGVARRVRLRQLMADLLPMFSDPLQESLWQDLVSKYDIIGHFKQGDLWEWLRQLPSSSQHYVLQLVRSVLEQLRHTGIDSKGTSLLIAWPDKHDIQRAFRVPCKEQSGWISILADTEDCATFAYITTKCLENENFKCRGPHSAWQNSSCLLATAVSRVGGDIAPNSSPWELEDNKIYFVQKLNSLVRIKVERPVKGGTPHLIVLPSKIPANMWKRILQKEEKRRIREKQAIGDRSEEVIVCTSLKLT